MSRRKYKWSQSEELALAMSIRLYGLSWAKIETVSSISTPLLFLRIPTDFLLLQNPLDACMVGRDHHKIKDKAYTMKKAYIMEGIPLPRNLGSLKLRYREEQELLDLGHGVFDLEESDDYAESQLQQYLSARNYTPRTEAGTSSSSAALLGLGGAATHAITESTAPSTTVATVGNKKDNKGLSHGTRVSTTKKIRYTPY